MRRYFVLFAALFVTNLLVGAAISLVGFRHLDIRLPAITALLVVPAAQAAALHVVTAQDLSLAAFRPGLSLYAGTLLGLDLLLLAPGVFVQPAYAGAKMVAAGLGLLALGGRRRSVAIAVAGAGALAFAADSFRPWLHVLPDSVMVGKPIVLRWIVVYGTLFVVALVVLLRAGKALGGGADLWLQAAALAAFAATIVAVPGYFQRPVLTGTSAKVVSGLGSLVATGLLAGAIAGIVELRSPRGRPEAAQGDGAPRA